MKASDGERYGLPTRGSLGGSLHLPFRPNHVLGIALDLGHSSGEESPVWPQEPNTPFSGTVSCAADTTSVRRTKAPGNYASLGCGFIAGPVRCDAAWRFGGNKFNPLNDTFLFSVGFLL